MTDHPDPLVPNALPAEGPLPDAIPEWLSAVPLRRLLLRREHLDHLEQRGIIVIGDLVAVGSAALVAEGVQSRKQAARLDEILAVLARIPEERAAALAPADAAGWQLPRTEAAVLGRLAAARDLSSELEALVHGLPDRDAGFVCQRWRWYGEDAPTLDEIGEAAEVTRERVRQIVEGHENRLRDAGLRLPIASRAAELLEASGGALSGPQFARSLVEAGVSLEGPPLFVLPRLAELGLIPPVRYAPDLRLWLSTSGQARHESGELADAVRPLLHWARAELNRTGVLHAPTAEARAPFGADHLLSLCRPATDWLDRVGEYLVPLPPRASALTRAADKILAVAGSVSVASLHRGLSRMLRKLDPPPADVVGHLLSRSDRYRVQDGRVSTAVASSRDLEVLSPSERAAVALFERAGNVFHPTTFVGAMEKEGFSRPMAHVLLRAPFVRRLFPGAYALRGRPVDPEVVTAAVMERRRERARNVVASAWDGDRLVVRYRITEFSRQGVLARPRELKDAPERWEARLPDGTTQPLTMRKGLLWSLARWFSRAGLIPGNHVVLVFDPAGRRAEVLCEEQGGEAHPQEADGAPGISGAPPEPVTSAAPQQGVEGPGTIPDWNGRPVAVARSVGGVLAVADPWDGLIRGGVAPWPPPELVQKLYQSRQARAFRGSEHARATARLDFYSDLQSLNSEDALTWSVFGPIAYAAPEVRRDFARALLERLGLDAGPFQAVTIWLWRRLPHPDTLVPGGPEIDFGLQTEHLLLLGEAKWRSAVGDRQGASGRKDQITLRREFCRKYGTRFFPGLRRFVVLGVSPRGSMVTELDAEEAGAGLHTRDLRWRDLCALPEHPCGEELLRYLAWKAEWSAPGGSFPVTAR